MIVSWLSLVPTLIVVILAIYTHSINSAFLGGILIAGIIATHGSIPNTFALIAKHMYTQLTDPDTLFLYFFLISIATMAILITKTGCSAAFTHKMAPYMRSKKKIEASTVAFSFLMSVDDYLSILSVGHVMRFLTDTFGISRLRLAYLVHSLAGPLVILMPISSWVATITNQLYIAGVQTEPGALVFEDPFKTYLYTIPYMFYSLLIILSVFFVVSRRIKLGSMDINSHYEEKNTKQITTRGSLAGLLVPLCTLLATFIIGSIVIPNNTFFVMVIAGCISLAVALGYALLEKTISIIEIPALALEGAQLMKSALITIFLASILALLLRENLHTGLFLAQMVKTATALHLLPFIFFCLSLTCAIATGSAWGTFSLMISIAIPMLTSLVANTVVTSQHISLLYPVLGAIFSGAVCGDHVSPFSETTVMTASSTQTNPLQHAYSQFFYAMPAIVGSAAAYFSYSYFMETSYWTQALLPLLIGICVGALIMFLLKNNE